jgi:hypothetical protein
MNTQTQEALKMAIECLEYHNEQGAWGCDLEGTINACKEALEQPEGKEFFERGKEIARWADKQAQEPVGWMKSALDNARDVCKYLDHDMVKEAKEHTEFFWNDMDKIREFNDTSPHQWQGLTDDEIDNLMIGKNGVYHNFARAIEAKLKEKNYG